MRRILFGAVIVSAFLSAASLNIVKAADLNLKAPPAAAPWPCPFCGWYAGLNAGYGMTSGGGYNATGTDTGTAGLGSDLALGYIPNSLDALSPAGFVGGGQIGYNWQFPKGFIMGIEADVDGIASAKKTVPASALGVGLNTNFERDVDWFSTLRFKAGTQVMNNSLYIYASAGGAVAQWGIGSQFICTVVSATCPASTAGQPATANSSKSTQFGGAGGFGLEWMIAPHVSLKAEYLYIETGNSHSTISYSYPGPNTSSLTITSRDSFNVVRGGLNWFF